MFLSFWSTASAVAQTNIHELPSDLTVPAVVEGVPEAGKRVQQRNVGFEDGGIYHALYLPPDWKAGEKYPVIVEYPGNGGYSNALGDRSVGRVEDCKLGYGISGGRRMIWVSLPFVDLKQRKHALNWWGDADATAAYCRTTVERICADYGGDRDAVILTGFSRGAIACGYIGLRDDATAKLWRAIIAHSHYDGVRRWGFSDDDEASAAKRLVRFHGKPQFISHEKSIDDTAAYLKRHDGLTSTTLLAIPYPNHSDEWVLKDIPERKQLRTWLDKVLAPTTR
ncbi:MAG: hypothetical protein K8U03_06805 [Planctomycetia bacterium]|nr:hypothetical protein [Planctomycetia bacterium]